MMKNLSNFLLASSILLQSSCDQNNPNQLQLDTISPVIQEIRSKINFKDTLKPQEYIKLDNLFTDLILELNGDTYKNNLIENSDERIVWQAPNVWQGGINTIILTKPTEEAKDTYGFSLIRHWKNQAGENEDGPYYDEYQIKWDVFYRSSTKKYYYDYPAMGDYEALHPGTTIKEFSDIMKMKDVKDDIETKIYEGLTCCGQFESSD